MRISVKLAAIAVLAIASASVPAAERLVPTALAPALTSIGPLAFSADGMLYAADRDAATIYALDLGTQASGTAGTMAVDKIDEKIAGVLGTTAAEITIGDLAVHPKSKNSFLAVMRGQGANARPALLRVDGAGKVELVSMDTVKFTSVALPNPAAVSTTGRGGRTQSVTDMALVNGRLWVAGLSNEEFASKLWSVAYPFTTADRGTSVEIYHGNHGAIETRSPVMTFMPLAVAGQQTIVAAYTCTPLVRFSVGGLTPGQKVVGHTMMDLGAGNQPIDMVAYSKGGQDYLLMANNRHGIVKVPTAQFATAPAITAKVDTAGTFEKVASMPGVVQLDLLSPQQAVSIVQTVANGPRSLAINDLP